MNSKILKILKKIEENGFEAYVVGGYVRDYILGIETTDVDICTNALPKNLMNIFDVTNHSYGSISLSDGKYNYDITTYRSEEKYDKRKPQEVSYVDNLITDIKRRDFTINSLCMNADGTIIDLLDGQEDINKRRIKTIGSVEKRLTEDPLRILRAVRFSITLNFKLDEDIAKFIQEHKDLIKTLSYHRRQEEINRILSSKNASIGLKTLKELNLLEVLEIDYDEIIPVPDILGIWAQMKYNNNYPFTKSSREIIENIRKILDKGIIDNMDLYKYNLYIPMVAGEILGYSREEITQRYADLPVKNSKELKLNSKDIFTILEMKPSSKVKIIYNDLLMQVLNNKLSNDYEVLKKYILRKWK